MTPVIRQNFASLKEGRKSSVIILTSFTLLLIGCLGAYMWSTPDLQSFDQRLNVSFIIEGPDVEIQKLNWMTFSNEPAPVIWVGFETVNTSNVDLEIVSMTATVRDPLGREVTKGPIDLKGSYWDNIYQGHVLLAGEARPENIQILLSDLSSPLLTWDEVVITLEVREAAPEALERYWRSYNITIYSAGYIDDEYYVIEGMVEDFNAFADDFRDSRKGKLKVDVVISLYSEDDEFLGAYYYPLINGEQGYFKIKMLIPLPPSSVTSYKVWFAEWAPR